MASVHEDPELELLDDAVEDESTAAGHAYRTAPIFTGDALNCLGETVLPQRALYGRVLAQKASGFPIHPANKKLYMNTNAPFSALVCGVQGSGKSHSTSVLLESCLIKDGRLGTLPEPLSALVFHFDTAAGGGCVQPCEAAYLSSLDRVRGKNAQPPKVTVLVLPTNLQPMRKVYSGLQNVRVEPLHFAPEDISGERLLAMMKVEENSQMPLYMEAIMSILRSMEGNFDYATFRKELKAQPFNPAQKAMLNLRLSLLDSCLEGGNLSNRVSTHFKKGHLTIIDLSSAFMDGSSACGFFDLILGLFVEADVKAAGKLVVLDEAHKYLSDTQSGTSSRLTDSLLTVIRQQRHLATRVVISTQEPTVVPSKFLDLCSFIIAHRFSSPTWLKLLAKHVSAAETSFNELFEKVVSLRTGQAILFAASGVGVRESESDTGAWGSDSADDSGFGSTEDASSVGTVAPLGQGYLLVQSRLRVTRDGGHSILAVNDPEKTTRFGRVHVQEEASLPLETEDAATEDAKATDMEEVDAEVEDEDDPFEDAVSEHEDVPAPHTSSGGPPAPAEPAAEAVVPPGPEPDPNAGGAKAEGLTTHATERAPGPQVPVKAEESLALVLRDPRQAVVLVPPPTFFSPKQGSTSPPVPSVSAGSAVVPNLSPAQGPVRFSLSGKLAKFKPLVDCIIQKMKPEKNINHAVLQSLQNHFASITDFDQTVDEALRLGIIVHAGHLGGQRLVRLNHDAVYDGYENLTVRMPKSVLLPTSAAESPPAEAIKVASGSKVTAPSASMSPLQKPALQKVELTGQKAKFKPLIRHLIQARDLNSANSIQMKTLRKRFGPSLDGLVADGVAQGFLRLLDPSTKPKLMLSPKTNFVL